MALHLIKLCVGCDSVEELTGWIRERLREKKRQGLPQHHIHTTRMMPKRVDELMEGGSLYWVIRGEILCRQRLKEVRATIDAEGVSRCQLVLDRKVVTVQPRPCRPFQGWRYLQAKDAPGDLDAAGRKFVMPEPMRRELRELGLL